MYLKKIGLLICFMCAHHLCAMNMGKNEIIVPPSNEELKIIRNQWPFKYEHTAEKFMRELPFMSHNLVSIRYGLCSEKVRQDIDKQLRHKENEFFVELYHHWEPLFTFLLNNDQILYKISKNLPIACIGGSLRALGKDNIDVWKDRFAKELGDRLARYDFVFRYSNEIQLWKSDFYVIDGNCVQLKERACALRMLKFFGIVDREINIADNEQRLIKDNRGTKFSYVYRKSFTFMNFLRAFKNREEVCSTYFWCIMPMVSWLALHYSVRGSENILTADDIRYNNLAIQFNEGLRWAKEQQNNSVIKDILPYIDFKSEKSLIEPYLSRFGNFKFTVFVVGPYLLSVFKSLVSFYTCKSTSFLIGLGVSLRPYLGWLITSSILYFVGPVRLPLIYSMTGVSLFFLCLASLLNIEDMMKIHEDVINFDKIFELLQKHDRGEIEILNHCQT